MMTGWIGRNRGWLLPLLAVGVWLVWCLPPLLQNQPEAFQDSGSVIVVIAILIYARERLLREAEVAEAQHMQIEAILDQHDTWGDYHESRARRDSIENELRVLQLRQTIEKNSKDKKAVSIRIKELEDSLVASHGRHEELETRMNASFDQSMEAIKTGDKIVQEESLAARLLQRLEIALVVLGTLQWGYGDNWVRVLHGG